MISLTLNIPMDIDDLLKDPNSESGELWLLNTRCSQFICESGTIPLLKNLPVSYEDFHRVKVRKRKIDDEFDNVFNEAFCDEVYQLRQRAMFANGPDSFEVAVDERSEPFFVFPIDGFKFMYSSEVKNSNDDYKAVFETIVERCGDDSLDMVTDLLKFTYTHERLCEGLENGCEIIIYNIPFYYALRASTVDDYDELLTSLTELT